MPKDVNSGTILYMNINMRLGENILKKLLLTLVVAISFSITGCTQSANISDAKYNVVAEYMASAILKYDRYYEEQLEDVVLVAHAQEISKDQDNGIGNGVTNINDTTVANDVSLSPEGVETINLTQTQPSETSQYSELSEVIGKKDFDIQFKNLNLYQSFPNAKNNAYFTIEARSNKKLMVLEFDIKNKTTENKNINLMDSDITYQLVINEGSNYKSLMTLLLNDLQFIDVDIKGEKSEKGYLVFEVSRDVKTDNMKLLVSRDSLEASIDLK